MVFKLKYDLTIYDHTEPYDEYFRDYCLNNGIYKSVKFYGLTLKQVFSVIRANEDNLGRNNMHCKLKVT